MVSYKLHVQCPECNAKDKTRLAVIGEEGDEAEILCLECEASMEIDLTFVVGVLSAITEKAEEDKKVDHEWIEGLIHERMTQ